MRKGDWVVCITDEFFNYTKGKRYQLLRDLSANITTGKIYEVVEYVKLRPIVKIINDIGEERGVFLYDFEDVTAEVVADNRQEKLNQLGI